MICKYRITLKGVTPLLMHSCRTANPLDPYSKKIKSISSKRNKSDEDYVRMSLLEFEASSYYDEKIGYYLPAENIEACLISGAKSSKNGKKATLAIKVLENKVPLDLDTKVKPEELAHDEDFRDTRFVSVNRAKIMRTRPRFERWGCVCTVELDEDEMTAEQFVEAVSFAGKRACLGDYRPRYGAFEAKIEQIG